MPREFVNPVIYVVRPRDTLARIAREHSVTVAELVAANQGLIRDPNRIEVGWELVIPGELSTDPGPPPQGTDLEEHVVAGGDTLGALAAAWGTSVAAIAELNGIVNPNLIAVGQRIRRPTGTTGPAGGDVSGPVEDVAAMRSTRLTFLRLPLAPPARITGGFREDYGGYLHRGIDLGGVPVGTPIIAPAAGTVTVHRPGDGWGNGGFGICVVLKHPGTPWWSIYAHMNETERLNGDAVEPGDVIGFVGFTGKVVPEGPAGAHTHWQLSADPSFPIDFQFIANPLDFLQM